MQKRGLIISLIFITIISSSLSFVSAVDFSKVSIKSLEGSWQFSEDMKSNCHNSAEHDDYVVTIASGSNGEITMNFPTFTSTNGDYRGAQSLKATVSGNLITYNSGQTFFDISEGTVSVDSSSLTLSDTCNSFEGDLKWTWREHGGGDRCNGVSKLTATKKDNNGCKIICNEDWKCGEWEACDKGIQRRICSDANSCGTSAGKPVEAQRCTAEVKKEKGISIWIWVVIALAIAAVGYFGYKKFYLKKKK